MNIDDIMYLQNLETVETPLLTKSQAKIAEAFANNLLKDTDEIAAVFENPATDDTKKYYLNTVCEPDVRICFN
jgi:hypothetical protein